MIWYLVLQESYGYSCTTQMRTKENQYIPGTRSVLNTRTRAYTAGSPIPHIYIGPWTSPMMMTLIRTVYMISNENQRKSVVYIPGTRSVPNTRTGLYQVIYTMYLHIGPMTSLMMIILIGLTINVDTSVIPGTVPGTGMYP